NDITDVTTLLGNFSAGYKFTDWLEYKMLYGVNYSSGNRKAEIQGWIRSIGGNAQDKGEAGVFQNNLKSTTVTHTLNFVKDLTEDLNLNVVAGYEFWRTNFNGFGNYVYEFNYNRTQATQTNVHYYDNMGAGKQGNLQTVSFKEAAVD